jgi:hypothetical protein
LNLKIKFRESFRPFAPSVLRERVADFFELNRQSPYMLLVAPVKEKLRLNGQSDGAGEDFLARLKTTRSALPAITHVDYSARVQTVAAGDNPRFHRLLSEFEKNTGCAVLVNTSFNVRGEPPVCTPEDAFRCFMRTGMDYVVLGNFLLDKTKQNSRNGGFPTADPNKTAIWKSPLLGEEFQELDQSPRALRRFGFTVGLVMLLLGSLLLWRQHRATGWPLTSLGSLLLIGAGFFPTALKYLHRPWMILSLALGWIMSRVLLTIVFFLVVTPIGLLQRFFGKRAIEVDFRTEAASYWQLRTERFTPANYEKQF